MYLLDAAPDFPEPSLAHTDPNGLLACGGDLSVARLKTAYKNGIFPWYCDGQPILWWSPDPRGILPLEEYHCSKSMKKFLKRTDFAVTVNHAFPEVISHCADVKRDDVDEGSSWITHEMQEAYIALHQAGEAHSIEVWCNEQLVGGLYGIAVGQVFCGESMFHTMSNASKLAFYCLVNHLKANQFKIIDCQMQTEHLATLGARDIPRVDFLNLLEQFKNEPVSAGCWQPKRLF